MFAYDFLVSRSHTDQICVVATCTSNRLFSFQVLVESVVLVSFEQRRTLFWNGFLTIMSTPDDGWHKRWMSNKLTNGSFVPKAILQPHTSRQQLKLIAWAPSYLLQLSTEEFGFPEVRFVFQRLAAYIQQVGAIGPHSTPASIPTTPLKHLYKGHSDLQISRSIGYLPGCILFSLSATLDN